MRWTELLSEEERARLAHGGWGRTGGIGHRPALLIIDAQNYMVGEPDAPDNLDRFPFSCGPDAPAAIGQIARILDRFRDAGWPVVFTRFVQRRDTTEAAALHRKLKGASRDSEGLYFEGTFGAEIVTALSPLPDEPVIDKRGRSAFFATDLHTRLTAWEVDTCIVTGGSTSGCIRPTVCDAEQYGYRVVVPADAVFDRFAISHTINLFDIQRAQADVMPLAELLSRLPVSGLRGRPEPANMRPGSGTKPDNAP